MSSDNNTAAGHKKKIGTIKHRFVEYEAKTKPVLDYYKGTGKLHAVNGVGEIPEIFKKLCGVIDTL